LRDTVSVVVVARAGQFPRFVQVQFIHIKSLTHRVASRLIMAGATEPFSVFVGSGAGHVRVSVNVLDDLVDVLLLHVFAAHAKRVRLASAVFQVVDALAAGLAHASSKIGGIVVTTQRCPVFGIGVADACVPKTLRPRHKAGRRFDVQSLELRLMVVAGDLVVRSG